MKKKPPFNQEMAIRGANRRLFARSPLVVEKLNESRQEFPRYKKDGTLAKKLWVRRQCEACDEWVGSTQISIDHIDPVVPPEGFPAHFDMWDRINLFLRRLWCDKSNLQRICDSCHDKKTYKERIERLTKQYMSELAQIKSKMDDMSNCPTASNVAPTYLKQWNKELSKYTAKKKTKGLEPVVQKAQALKEEIKRWLKNVKYKKGSK